MATNLSALAPFTTTARALSNLVMVSPQSTVGYQPQNPPNADGSASTAQQPPSFIFNYEGEQTVSIESDITDHFIEDNTAIQDQISLKPELITTHGFIGELNDVPPFALAILKAVADKLTIIDGYTPVLTETALIAYAQAFQLYQIGVNAANAAVSAWSSINNVLTGADGQSVIGNNGLVPATNQNKQQTAFQQFYGFWQSRTLFTVQTPWAVFQNMAILKLRAIQDDQTRMITDFDVTFKRIRTAATVAVNPALFAGQAIAQAATATVLGTAAPVSSISLTTALAGMGL